MTDTAIKKSVFINASKDKVWTYLVNKDKLGDWYHPAEKNLADGESYVLLGRDEKGESKKTGLGRRP